MNLTTNFTSLAIALGLGLLVGLQRESVASRLAGLRTFPLITMLGVVCGLLSRGQGGWVPAAGLLALAAMIYAGKDADAHSGHLDPGLTTEAAILLMYGVGALLAIGPPEVAIAIGGLTAVLLHFKGELHSAVARLTAGDLRQIMQFALISLVILPVLPDRAYGPYAVINPRNIWLMVVLIVGIGLVGYISYKFVGERVGLLLSGILGGLISSTATTFSFSRRSTAAGSGFGSAVVVLLSSAVVFLRLLIEIAAVEKELLVAAIGPLLVMMAFLLLTVALLWLRHRPGTGHLPEPSNPTHLRSALFFAIVYGMILLLVAFARERFGDRGLYLVAALSGLTDVDAITLSTAQLVQLDRLAEGQGWRVIVVAAISNLFFKLGTVLSLGDRHLKLWAGLGFSMAMLVGLALLRWWPF